MLELAYQNKTGKIEYFWILQFISFTMIYSLRRFSSIEQTKIFQEGTLRSTVILS